jgi:hypothetical protein
MRHNPILSEADAFRLTVTGVALVALGGLIGWLTAPAVGVAVFAVLALVALGIYMSTPEHDRPRPLHKAAHERHRHGAPPGPRHVIVIANEALAGDALGAHIRSNDGQAVEVDVLAPLRTSRIHLAYTDIDHELHDARERLSRSLAWAHEQGLNARGAVGDANLAVALEDELRDFGADEVIIASGGSRPSPAQEQAELRRLREELDVPVVAVPVG